MSQRQTATESQAVPPHSPEAEVGVLGAILQWPQDLEVAATALQSGDFYDTAHQTIFSACLSLRALGIPADPRSVLVLLDERHWMSALECHGGSAYLLQLVDGVATGTQTPFYCRVIRRKAKCRRAMSIVSRFSAQAATNGANMDVLYATLLDDLEELTAATEAPTETPDLTCGADAFLTEPPPLAWDIEYIRVQGDHGWTGGAPKSMKGYLSLEEARATATGTPFLGKFPTQQRRVLYVSEEDRPERLHRRFHFLAVKDRPAEEIPTPELLRFLIKKGVRIDTGKGTEILRSQIARWRPELVFLEHFDKLHAKSPNKPEEMKPLLDVLDELHREFGCTFRAQKHFRKLQAGQGGRTGEMISGTQALFGWGESSVYLTLIKRGEAVVEVEAKDGDTAARFLVKYQQGKLVYGGEATAEAKANQGEKNQAKVLQAVTDAPGSTVAELVERVKLTDKTVRNHLRALEKAQSVVGKQHSTKQKAQYWPKSAEPQGDLLGK